jgi:hypothetical protein
MVLISTGHSDGRTMTMSSVWIEKPNSSSATGTNAMAGMGRRTSMVASEYRRNSGEKPMSRPPW